MNQIDLNKLKQKFHISLHPREDAILSFPAVDLLVPGHLTTLIETYAPYIKAKNLQVAGVYTGSWLGFVAMAKQYALSVWNQSLDLSLHNLTIQLVLNGEFAGFSYVMNHYSSHEADEQPMTWRQQELSQFHSGTIRPLIEALSSLVNYPVGQIWGQLPTKFNYYMDHWKAEYIDHLTITNQLQEDYQSLKEINPDLFGLKSNPFDVKIRLLEDSLDPCKQVRMKNACCLYYQTEAGRYCYTCPRMKEEERTAWRDNYRAEQAAVAR
jgi:ferric iron reductase protein FhuF